MDSGGGFSTVLASSGTVLAIAGDNWSDTKSNGNWFGYKCSNNQSFSSYKSNISNWWQYGRNQLAVVKTIPATGDNKLATINWQQERKDNNQLDKN